MKQQVRTERRSDDELGSKILFYMQINVPSSKEQMLNAFLSGWKSMIDCFLLRNRPSVTIMRARPMEVSLQVHFYSS
jgi:hypothetical protein